MRTLSIKFTLAAIGAISLSLSGQATAAPAVNWKQTVSQTPSGGYTMGNPAAPNHVIEFSSYTCSHCATFEINEAPKLKAQYVSSGKVSFEIRSYVRDSVDVTIAMLAQCGGKGRFFGNHKFLMSNQAAILDKAKLISAANQAKWQAGDFTGFMLGAFTDMGLAKLIAPRGITNAQARVCLSDTAALQKIIKIGQEAAAQYKINGTPAFIINGNFAEVQQNDIASLSTFFKNK